MGMADIEIEIGADVEIEVEAEVEVEAPDVVVEADLVIEADLDAPIIEVEAGGSSEGSGAKCGLLWIILAILFALSAVLCILVFISYRFDDWNASWLRHQWWIICTFLLL